MTQGVATFQACEAIGAFCRPASKDISTHDSRFAQILSTSTNLPVPKRSYYEKRKATTSASGVPWAAEFGSGVSERQESASASGRQSQIGRNSSTSKLA